MLVVSAVNSSAVMLERVASIHSVFHAGHGDLEVGFKKKASGCNNPGTTVGIKKSGTTK